MGTVPAPDMGLPDRCVLVMRVSHSAKSQNCDLDQFTSPRIRDDNFQRSFRSMVLPSSHGVRRLAMKVVNKVGRLCGDRGETAAMHAAIGYFPNLLFPRSFNEKLVRRKLGQTPAIWSEYADKLRVRDHVTRLAPDLTLTALHDVASDPD